MAESRSSVGAVVLALLAGALLAVPGTIVLYRKHGPALTAVAPARARPGDTLVLTGARFEATPQANVVLFGDQTGRVVSAKTDEMQVVVPEVAVAEGGELRLGVRVLAGDRASAPLDVTLYRERTTDASQPAAASSAAMAAPAPVPAPPPPSAPASSSLAPLLPRPLPGTASTSARPPSTTPPSEPRPQVEAPKPAPPTELPAARQREFVFDRTAAESNKRAAGGLAGFDTSTVDLKRAPDVVGRIDFEVAPSHVKAGDHYTVKAFLINDGPKAIRIKEVFVATTLNGALSAGPIAPRLREVAPREREILAVFSDTWKEGIGAWAMDVTVTSDRGDVYKNQVAWK